MFLKSNQLGATLVMDGNGGNRGENLGGDGGEECREKRRENCVKVAWKLREKSRCVLMRKTR